MAQKIQTIADFFKNRCVFITGASGFMGKVLVEKLIRSCPDINTIYLLMREKKGKSIQTRLNDMLNTPLFERIRREKPEICEEKIRIILGNVKELNLGLSAEDQKVLEDNVSVIFHAAASVRFDDPLKDAVLLNTRGTREVMKLAQNMKQLRVLLHISTTYCNTDKKIIYEHVYPPHADWKKTIDICENYDEETLKILTIPYIHPLPNTYTFAKSLAEHVVADMANQHVPAVIFRPSIVISSLHEPMPGWIDNFHGPAGLLMASGIGIMRTMCSDPNIVSDYIPVDVAVKAMIVAAWKKGTEVDEIEKYQVSVYNCSSNGVKAASLQQVIEMAKEFVRETPVNNMLWAPGGGITKYKLWNYILVLFVHVLPAIFIDIILRLGGHDFSLLKLQRKIYTANNALHYFISNQWTFRNGNFLKLQEQILPVDIQQWDFDFSTENIKTYFRICIIGAKQYLLKEKLEDLPQARKKYQRLVWLDKGLKMFLVFAVIYLIITSNVFGHFYYTVNDWKNEFVADL